MKDKRFQSADVSKVFKRYPTEIRKKLMFLRRLIFETAAETPGVGRIEEALRWGEPSYLTPETGSGSMIRINQRSDGYGNYAMYVHCQTDLVATFKRIYPGLFVYEGNRAILFDKDEKVPVDRLRHCISLALTYHLDKKQQARPTGREAR